MHLSFRFCAPSHRLPPPTAASVSSLNYRIRVLAEKRDYVAVVVSRVSSSAGVAPLLTLNRRTFLRSPPPTNWVKRIRFRQFTLAPARRKVISIVGISYTTRERGALSMLPFFIPLATTTCAILSATSVRSLANLSRVGLVGKFLVAIFLLCCPLLARVRRIINPFNAGASLF